LGASATPFIALQNVPRVWAGRRIRLCRPVAMSLGSFRKISCGLQVTAEKQLAAAAAGLFCPLSDDLPAFPGLVVWGTDSTENRHITNAAVVRQRATQMHLSADRRVSSRPVRIRAALRT